VAIGTAQLADPLPNGLSGRSSRAMTELILALDLPARPDMRCRSAASPAGSRSAQSDDRRRPLGGSFARGLQVFPISSGAISPLQWPGGDAAGQLGVRMAAVHARGEVRC
jgi:hypothetical protein